MKIQSNISYIWITFSTLDTNVEIITIWFTILIDIPLSEYVGMFTVSVTAGYDGVGGMIYGGGGGGRLLGRASTQSTRASQAEDEQAYSGDWPAGWMCFSVEFVHVFYTHALNFMWFRKPFNRKRRFFIILSKNKYLSWREFKFITKKENF